MRLRMKAGSLLGVFLFLLLACGAAWGASAGSELLYSTYFGGSDEGSLSYDAAYALAADEAGNVWVAGRARTKNFPVTEDARQKNLEGEYDAFLAKFSSSGELLYATYLGGDGDDEANALAVDAAGNVWVAGGTGSKNFPITKNARQKNLEGNYDVFLAQFSSSGELLYATYLGGDGDDVAHALAVDASGDIWITGNTESKNFPVTKDAWQKNHGEDGDSFVSKFSSKGELLYSTYLGGDGWNVALALAVDAACNVWVTGHTGSKNFPVTENACQKNSGGSSDAFVTKFSPSGNLLYSTYLGGNDADEANALAVDTAGNVWVAGGTDSKNFPVTKNAWQKGLKGDYDAFVAKFSPKGELLYSTYLGGNSARAQALAVDAACNVWVTGHTGSKNFPVTENALQKNHGGETDAFVSKFSPKGQLLYASYLGGNNWDIAYALAVDTADNVWVAGGTGSKNFPVTEKAWQKELKGDFDNFDSDAFVVKF